jgi:hypothetical protein
MNNEDALISQLIEETYVEPVEKDQPETFVDLRKYFEKRLNQVDYISIIEYLNQHQLSHNELILEDTGCYRLNFKQTVIDFPSNWSIFNEIKNTEFVYVDQSLDQDYLLDIFSEICGSFQNIALIKENQEIQLVFIPDENPSEHIKWIQGYFDKRKNINVESSPEKAA